METILSAINNELEELLQLYKGKPVSELLLQYTVNTNSKSKLRSLSEYIINNSDKTKLKQFIQREDVQIKTVNLVRGGKVEASLSLPSFDFCQIVEETWENSTLRKTLVSTTFLLLFFEEDTYGQKDKYLRTGFIWKMPANIIDEGVRQCWEQVVDCLRSGRIIKYIGEDGREHTYFPRTVDGPYVHVRPHAASGAPLSPLPVPDRLTGMKEYKRYSFWITRSYIEKILYQGGYLN